MPELPEVETIKKDLKKNLVGKKIIGLKVFDAKSVEYREAKLKQEILGKEIKGIERKAKMLIFHLSGQAFLAIHLKITGQLIIKKTKDPLDRFTRVMILLSGGSKFFFNDLRKFGWLKSFPTKQGLNDFINKFKLGIEPLSSSFTFNKLNQLLNKRRNMVIKPFLLDQGLVSGIGNIYASEILYYARVRPTRRVKSLNQASRKRLFQEITRVLKLAVKQKGTSVDQYVDAFGKKGNYDTMLKVYNRKGKKCFRCQGEIRMVKVNARGTYFCPNCQK